MREWLSNYAHIAKLTYKDDWVDMCIQDYQQVHTFIKDITETFDLKGVYNYLTREFTPTETYRLQTPQGDTLILTLEDTPILQAYNSAYQVLVHSTLPIKGVVFFEWLVQHTTPLMSDTQHIILKGDRIFNQSIQLQAVRDLYTVMDSVPLTLKGSHITIKNTLDVSQYMHDNHWKVGTQYYIKGKGDYYLPFTVELEEDEVIQWVQSLKITPNRLIESYIKGDRIDINIKGKDDFMWFVGRVTKDLGTQDLLKQVLTQFKVGQTYTFKYQTYTFTVHHGWVDHNIHYAESVYTLVSHYDFSVATNKKHLVMIYYQVLEDSQYNPYTQGISLKGYLYAELGVSHELLVGKLQEVGLDTYAARWDDAGDVLPITFTIGGIRIDAPYYKVYANQFNKGYYPILTTPSYKQKALGESYLNPYILNEGRSYRFSVKRDIFNNKKEQDKRTHTLEEYISQLNFDEVLKTIKVKPQTESNKSQLPLEQRVANLPHVRDAQYNQDNQLLIVNFNQQGESLTYDLSQYQRDRDVLYAIIKQTQDTPNDAQERDVLNLVLSVFEESEWDKTYEEDPEYQTLWLNYLERIVTHARVTYTTGVGYSELINLVNTMPVIQNQTVPNLSDVLGFSVQHTNTQGEQINSQEEDLSHETHEAHDDQEESEGFNPMDLSSLL